MNHQVSLVVSFPRFGKNYYSQHAVSRKDVALIVDKRFDPFLMSAATHHFNNEVIGFNDQFRFLSEVLSSHLLDIETSQPAQPSRQAAQRHGAR
ncbi:hypothetical protein [Pseudomonas fluorescens]|uniref:Uncharacterized protein n=1 Tax=Pseudomonas fluorescens TaxID=294 RepID=A0A5E7FD03_PSEFL|nr:hypothetical protein [Pseudomonas fluorescens]VVO35907.1 hypothetical protein PS723_05369 [Pseudomonas fluorescens]